MPARRLRVAQDLPADLAARLTARLAALRTELDVPGDFAAEVVAAAEQAIAAPRLPDLDRTDLELITIDPPGSRDLDQALHLAADGDGFVLSYAIADVGAFVSPGDPLDLESHRRGVTYYAPDHKEPLYPSVMSEGGASLLPDQVRPALLWTLRVDATGALTDTEVVRARVRSRVQLTYTQAQQAIDAGADGGELLADLPDELRAHPAALQTLRLLSVVGPLREQAERDRGGVSLNLPEQEIRTDADSWRLEFRAALPVEGWNAQVSLLTGTAAARLQLDARIGLLRTLPPATADSVDRLRRTARALHLSWPDDTSYPEFVRTLDPTRPADAAMLTACTSLFRGAGYQAFDGALPEQTEHAALATPYAHATAPLRRLADRYTGEVCLALHAGEPVPDWVRTALPGLPEEMQRSERLEKKFERGVLDLAEVVVLAGRVGEDFEGAVLETDAAGRRGVVLIMDPAVEAKITGEDLPLGQTVRARLVSADLDQGAVTFAQV